MKYLECFGAWTAGFVLKHDAIISGGNSGGPLADGDYRLLGLNTFGVSDDGAQLAFAMPVYRISIEWMQMIGD